MNDKYRHLCMIEKVIERMSKNSFTLKGWALTLVVLVGSFSAYGSNQNYIIIAFLPIVCFWFLDAFYLWQERKYRLLYKDVQRKNVAEIDFSLDTDQIGENARGKEKRKICYFFCLFSVSEGVFYIPITIGLVILVVVLCCC